MRTTIKMVAQHAGVSRGTVDRVLNKRGSVKPEVEERILESIKELNYQPNTAARALSFNKKTKKIGFLIPNKISFFKEEVTRGISRGQEDSEYLGIDVLVAECDPNNPQEYVKKIDEMLSNDVCGFAISAQNTAIMVEKINELCESGIPVITVNSDIPESRRNCFIGENALKSGRIAGEIIYKNKREKDKILIVAGIPEFDAHVTRPRGFLDYMTEHGVSEFDCQLIYTYENYELTYQKVVESIKNNSEITNIYLATNSINACADALKSLNLEKKIFIVTHDIAPNTLELLKEEIVDFTIDQDMFRQGYKPIQLLRDYYLLNSPIEDLENKSVYHIVSSQCI